MVNIAVVSVGCLFLVIAIIGYIFPFQDTSSPDPAATETIPQAVRVCNSEMGQLAQSYSAEISKICSDYNVMIMGVYGSGILGLVLIVVGAVVSRGQKEDHHEKEVEDDPIDILEKRYAKGEITKEEFDDMKKNLE